MTQLPINTILTGDAKKLERNFIGIELNPDYVKIAERKLRRELGVFL